MFAGVGDRRRAHGRHQRGGDRAVDELIRALDDGFVFTNLVETDQVFGHRNDVEGFHGALREIDRAVGSWLELLRPERDLLVLTADHGCDPTTRAPTTRASTCRCSPASPATAARRHDGPFADVGASVLRWLTRPRRRPARRDPFLP